MNGQGMTPDRWMDCLALMADLWPARPIEEGTAAEWYRLLADLDADQVEAAIRALMLDGREWPPNAGQIRQACQPPARPWEEAFADLRRLMARHGSYRPRPTPEEVGDPALSDVIDWLGWQAIAGMDPASSTVRAQFRDSYQAAQRRHAEQDQRATAAALTGGRAMRSLTGGAT